MGTETLKSAFITIGLIVEKMGPLRGDGNLLVLLRILLLLSREDGSPSWGRKLIF